jgi:hypothetical protein
VEAAIHRHVSARLAKVSRSSGVTALFDRTAHTRAISRNFFRLSSFLTSKSGVSLDVLAGRASKSLRY